MPWERSSIGLTSTAASYTGEAAVRFREFSKKSASASAKHNSPGAKYPTRCVSGLEAVETSREQVLGPESWTNHEFPLRSD